MTPSNTNVAIPITMPVTRTVAHSESRPRALFHTAYAILIPCFSFAATAIGGVVMPVSAISLIFYALLSLAQIRFQGQIGHLHLTLIRLCAVSLIMFGFAAAAALFASAPGFDGPPVYATIARAVMLGFLLLCIVLLASVVLF